MPPGIPQGQAAKNCSCSWTNNTGLLLTKAQLECGILAMNQVPITSTGIIVMVYMYGLSWDVAMGQSQNSLQLAADGNLMSLPAGLLECLEPQWSNVGAIVPLCRAITASRPNRNRR